jgi:hypothetical protein
MRSTTGVQTALRVFTFNLLDGSADTGVVRVRVRVRAGVGAGAGVGA